MLLFTHFKLKSVVVEFTTTYFQKLKIVVVEFNTYTIFVNKFLSEMSLPRKKIGTVVRQADVKMS